MVISSLIFKKTAPVLLGAFFVLVLASGRYLDGPEISSYDLRMAMRPALKVSDKIVIIEISDDTLKNLGLWPLPRDFHATITAVLKEAGARALVFDILFSEPSVYDKEFAETLKDFGRAYLGVAFDSGVSKNPRLLAGIAPQLTGAACAIGHINTVVDADGKIRKVPVFVSGGSAKTPQLGFKVACDILGLDISKSRLSAGALIIDGRMKLPLVDDKYLLVNYPGRWQDSFLHLSYFDILDSYNQLIDGKAPRIDLSVLKDKICFIGLTATGTSDFQPVPLENVYPLVGLQASITNSLLNNNFIHRASRGINALIALLIFFLSLYACLKFAPLKALLNNIVLGSVYFVIACLLFVLYGVWVDLFLPLAVVFALYLTLTVRRFFIENRLRQLLEKELEIARSIQESFLPDKPAITEGLGLHSHLSAAKFVAGDLYDLVALGDRSAGMFIADVAGKGVSASLVMAQVISLFRIYSRQYHDCARVLGLLNEELCSRESLRFVTALYIIIDTAKKTVSASSAGHGPLLIYRGSCVTVEEACLDQGLPLGIEKNAGYRNVEFTVSPGDRLMIFTDGLPESRNRKRQEFGTERIRDILIKSGAKDAGGISQAIMEEVARFCAGAAQHDDITLLVGAV